VLQATSDLKIFLRFSSFGDPDPVRSETFCWIRIRSLIRKNHSGSGQPGPGMKMKQNFFDKIHNVSTKCTIKMKFFLQTSLKSFKIQKD
jgi:hypothetical protein